MNNSYSNQRGQAEKDFRVGHNDEISKNSVERFETIIIGGGQAGLSIGYQLKQRGLPFVILDANKRIGDSWRKRWDSLKLFTPARYNGLAGMPFPGSPNSFPTKNAMADFLEHYARHFKLPLRNGINIDHLSKKGDWFIVKSGEQILEARNVVVAMASYQRPKIPSFAKDLKPGINQFHSIDYRNPAQLREGDVLIVGAGNSGSEIAMDIVKNHRVLISGRDVGQLPFRLDSRMAKLFFIPFVLRILFHRILTIHTRAGQLMRKKMLAQGGPLIRVRKKGMAAAGIERVPGVRGVKDGSPLLENGRVLDVKNVIWCTGFHPGFSWIKLPVLGEKEPHHTRGIVKSEPGLYFLGLHFLYAASSSMVQGLERDAKYIANDIDVRSSRNDYEGPIEVENRQVGEVRG